MKRLMALMLSCVMAMGMAVPALAADETTDPNTINIAGDIAVPEKTIDVVVPSEGKLVVNPYHIEVAAARFDGDGNSSDAILHVPQCVVNNSEDVDLLVNVTVTGSLSDKSTAAIATSNKVDNSKKQVFLYTEFETNSSSTDAPTNWGEYDRTNKNQVIVGKTAKTVTLEKKIAAKATDAKNAMWFKISGAVSDSSTVTWTADDNVNVKLAFTFIATPKGTTT